MKETRHTAGGAHHHVKGTADERAINLQARTNRALRSAERWLRRRGGSRENAQTKRAYTAAASRIHTLTTARG